MTCRLENYTLEENIVTEYTISGLLILYVDQSL